jgi:hypothetical protein
MRPGYGLACALLLTACGGEGDPATRALDVIERETFVDTYVQLRMASFDNTPRIITDGEKDRILAGQQVTEEELRNFLTVHGSDIPYVRDLWADIEAQILTLLSPNEELRPLPDSVVLGPGN